MKKRRRFFLLVFFLLFAALSFLPKEGADLGRFSFHFFQSLFQNERAREVFGLEEEAVAVLFETGEGTFL